VRDLCVSLFFFFVYVSFLCICVTRAAQHSSLGRTVWDLQSDSTSFDRGLWAAPMRATTTATTTPCGCASGAEQISLSYQTATCSYVDASPLAELPFSRAQLELFEESRGRRCNVPRIGAQVRATCTIFTVLLCVVVVSDVIENDIAAWHDIVEPSCDLAATTPTRGSLRSLYRETLLAYELHCGARSAD
jgi:hypothetical protein